MRILRSIVTPRPDEIPQGVRRVCERLHAAGFGAWIVGGCVRDLHLQREVADWDVCTSAEPKEVMRVFERVVPTGIAHGTVTVLDHADHYEVTTLRGDGSYTDGRRPDAVKFLREIDEDLARRDFTVNAMAFDVVRHALVDPHGGFEDLRQGLLRAVGDPSKRFGEDGLRVLRGARFVATLEFELAPETLAAIHGALATFRRVSRERVHDEWKKCMKAASPSRAFSVMKSQGILREISPSLADLSDDDWDVALRTMDTLPRQDAVLRLAGLMHRMSPRACDVLLKELKFSNNDHKRICTVVSAQQAMEGLDERAPSHRAFLRRWGTEVLDDLIALDTACRTESRHDAHEAVFVSMKKIIADRDALEPRQLAINGADLQRELGIPPSKLLGQMIEALMLWVLEEPSRNTSQALLDHAKSLK
ncbi:MAG: CCA tRNA nucleotidyltransferase [Deltaproteobacteria bacterium]|nr:CCA tRNA nucleotidyltransferase [Deltaproteobacteria bacterium]